MKFSEQWLRTWINPPLDSEALGECLTMAGLEIESREPVAPPFSGVVVAEVLSVRAHENADRLRVCSVHIGTAEPLQIVCGAPNVRAGLRVPCATIGAVLPGDFKIKATKMRGEASNGMLCSAKELGLPDGMDGLLELPADAPIGVDLRDFLNLDDSIFELKITPNRADCLSILGVAREVSALTGEPFCPPEFTPVTPKNVPTRQVRIDDPAACGRYLGRKIDGVNAQAATPAWMLDALTRAGLRSVSAIVDITNFVLLECGQPLHAFDDATLRGDITVRFAREGERLLLLNDKEITLENKDLLICDQDQPIALAGIMGGKATEVSDASTAIFLESAFFSPAAIAGRARRLGLSSDASFRFERGVDFALQRHAMERASRLIIDICGGEAGEIIEVVGELPQHAPIHIRANRVNRLLGLDLSAAQMQAYLQRLGLEVTLAGDILTATSISARFDLACEEDFMEEIARLHGYEHIPADKVVGRLRMLPLAENQRSKLALKDLLVARDFQEVITYAFVDEAWERDFAGQTRPIRLQNPIASQMSVMRSSLFGGLIDVLRDNLKRQQTRVRIFELARVFCPPDNENLAKNDVSGGQNLNIAQPEMLAGLVYGSRQPEQWGVRAERVDFFDLKADVEALLSPLLAQFRPTTHPALHPGRAADIILNGEVIGVLGELHPKWLQAYDLPAAALLFELQVSALTERTPPVILSVSKLPQVRRDLALLVDDDLPVATLLNTLQNAAASWVKAIEIFDLYRGQGVPEGKKSIAFKVLMQDTLRTLTDAELEETMQKLLQAAETLGAVLRV